MKRLIVFLTFAAARPALVLMLVLASPLIEAQLKSRVAGAGDSSAALERPAQTHASDSTNSPSDEAAISDNSRSKQVGSGEQPSESPRVS